MPANMKNYPANWKTEIRPRILARAGNKCERCGVANYAIGARDIHGVWRDEHSIHCMNSSEGEALYGDFPEMMKIVLTIAHVGNPDPMDVRDENLQALCQKCHNVLDAPMRAKHAAETRRQNKLVASGQMVMDI